MLRHSYGDLCRFVDFCTARHASFCYTGDQVVIIVDSHEQKCLELMSMLRHSYGDLCRFVDFCDHRYLDEVFAVHSEIPRSEICCRGSAAAILPEGVYFNHCEDNCKMLLYELNYRQLVPPPCPIFADLVERE